MDEWTTGQMCGHMDGVVEKQVNGWMNKRMDEQMNR